MFRSAFNVASDFLEGAVKNKNTVNQTIKAHNRSAVKAGQQALANAKAGGAAIDRATEKAIKRSAVDAAGGMKKYNAAHGMGNWVGGGIRDTISNMNNQNMNFGQAVRAAHTTGENLSMNKMAGTFVGVSAVGRVATGGGIMKDKSGNTNLIGIPFI